MRSLLVSLSPYIPLPILQGRSLIPVRRMQVGLGWGGGASLHRLQPILNQRFLDRPVKASMSGLGGRSLRRRRATRPVSVVTLHARGIRTLAQTQTSHLHLVEDSVTTWGRSLM